MTVKIVEFYFNIIISVKRLKLIFRKQRPIIHMSPSDTIWVEIVTWRNTHENFTYRWHNFRS